MLAELRVKSLLVAPLLCQIANEQGHQVKVSMASSSTSRGLTMPLSIISPQVTTSKWRANQTFHLRQGRITT